MRKLLILRKQAFFVTLQKIVDFYFYVYLQCMTTALQVGVFTFVRDILVC